MSGANLGHQLSQKLGQRLALTPQLTQSLKVLAMSSMELEAYIEECLESNPLLEVDPNIQQRDLAAEKNQTDTATQERDGEWQKEGDERWESMSANSRREGFEDQDQQWKDEQSLGESLHEQVNQQPMQDLERALAHALIDSLDDDGYFRSNPQELADDMGVTAEQVVDSLEQIIQELEPSGMGARDLSECLLLQLVGVDDGTHIARRLLLHFTEYLTEDDAALAERAACSVEDILSARQRMARLDPFPGHGLREEPNIYVRPEIIFRHLNSGEIEVEIPQSGWRGIRMSEQWKTHTWQGADRDFMTHASQEAKWLMYALEQRSETLKKVGLYLAKCQRNFLYHGILGLKPLTLQDVAEQVGLHESTISRVTHSKYAQTPLGLIELRRFFSSGLPTRGGGMISVYRVRQRMKSLIQSEPIGKPISDQAIADRLTSEGIEIARRTVAKYREQLGLPSSSQRRRAASARKLKVRR